MYRIEPERLSMQPHPQGSMREQWWIANRRQATARVLIDPACRPLLAAIDDHRGLKGGPDWARQTTVQLSTDPLIPP